MFMPSTTSLVTLAAFLVHAVWGCCAHHTHASEVPFNVVSDHVKTAASVDHADGHSHCSHGATREHQSVADEQPCENHEHPHQDCDEGSCSFAVSSKVKLPTPTVAATIEIVAPVDSLASILQTATQASLDFPLGASSTGRVRQLLQTWLL